MFNKLITYLFGELNPCKHEKSSTIINGAWYYTNCLNCGRKGHGSYGIEETKITDEKYYYYTEDEEGQRNCKIDKLLEE